MAHFDDIYEIAADNYGLVTAREAADAGATSVELGRWVKAGRLEHRGHGLYKIAHYIPTDYDRFAEAVALVGPGAYLMGISVLAMHNLGFVNPPKITVATRRRVRRRLPEWVEVVRAEGPAPTSYEGIPSQSVADALLACKGKVMGERLSDAMNDAYAKGLLKDEDRKRLKGELP